jgi:hypothetical protein
MWSAVLMSFACILVTSVGFYLNLDVHRESNDVVSNTSSKVPEFEKNANLSSNKLIDDNKDFTNKLKRGEDWSTGSRKEDSDQIYYHYEDDNGDGGDNDDDDDKDEEELDDISDQHEDGISEYKYDVSDHKNIRSAEYIRSEYGTEVLKAPREYSLESSEDRLEPITKYDDNIDNDSNDRNNYDDIKKQDDDNDDSEQHWPPFEEDKGVTAVADYVVGYNQGASSDEEGGKPGCLLGWRLDASGVCAPHRRKCEQGFVRTEQGDCVRPDTGHWYK